MKQTFNNIPALEGYSIEVSDNLYDEFRQQKNLINEKSILSPEALELMTLLTVKFGERFDELLQKRKDRTSSGAWKKFDKEALEFIKTDENGLFAGVSDKLKSAVENSPHYTANTSKKERLRGEGAHVTIIVSPAHKPGYPINVDNFRQKNPIGIVSDSEDAGSLDTRQEIYSSVKSAQVRNGGAVEKRPGKPDKKQNREIPEEKTDYYTTRRPNGLDVPKINTDDFWIVKKADQTGTKTAIPRHIFQFTLDVVAGQKDFLWAKIHTGEEAAMLNEMANFIEKYYAEKFKLTPSSIVFRFLIEVKDAPLQLLNIIHSTANRIRELVLGGWDLRAHAINTDIQDDEKPKDGVPNVRAIEKFVAVVANELGIPTCGSMFVNLFIHPLTSENEPDEEMRGVMNDLIDAINENVFDALKQQKKSDGELFERTWFAQTHAEGLKKSNEYMRSVLIQAGIEQARQEISSLTIEKIETGLTERISYDITLEQFEDIIYLLMRYSYLYVRDGNLCIAHNDFHQIKFDSNDLETIKNNELRSLLNHIMQFRGSNPDTYRSKIKELAGVCQKGTMQDPATGFHRAAALARQVVRLGKTLKSSSIHLSPEISKLLPKRSGETVNGSEILLNNTIEKVQDKLRKEFNTEDSSNQCLIETAKQMTYNLVLPQEAHAFVFDFILTERECFQRKQTEFQNEQENKNKDVQQESSLFENSASSFFKPRGDSDDQISADDMDYEPEQEGSQVCAL